jgi:hypothetical protein
MLAIIDTALSLLGMGIWLWPIVVPNQTGILIRAGIFRV